MSTTSENDQLERSLRTPQPVDAPHWDTLIAELGRRADAEGLIDVAFQRHDSPLGQLVVAASSEGLVRLGLPAEGEDAVLDELTERISPRILQTSRPTLTMARRELDEYFQHRRTQFDIPLDRRLTTGFRREVLQATVQIPYGQTSSYSHMAAATGHPRAARAAGSALANNPLPIIIPCHRVLKSNGDLGAYRGGPDAKALLIAHETYLSEGAAGD